MVSGLAARRIRPFTEILEMADASEAEIREIRLKIENLLKAANYRGLPQEATISYLKEVQKLRLRLLHLGVKPDDAQ